MSIIDIIRQGIDSAVTWVRKYWRPKEVPPPEEAPLPEWPLPEEEAPIPEEALPPEEEEEEAPVSVFCYRGMLTGPNRNYVGVTLYFIEREELPFFEAVQDHFTDQLELYMGMTYESSGPYTCDAEDIQMVSNVQESEFVFEIGDLESGKFKYWGYWHQQKWKPIKIFKEFDILTLTHILKER